ncbi:hypothetical protein [Salidesulfovibrio onnuriiensis]|uniref:hypothetical protein n=1 Tax=Salidesulfovibrio onnuriiensis TaxID=2583823 RepID=UPI0011CAA5AC|nr:hypothetical protein [Salidesulfovibrio onnuriiensis]
MPIVKKSLYLSLAALLTLTFHLCLAPQVLASGKKLSFSYEILVGENKIGSIKVTRTPVKYKGKPALLEQRNKKCLTTADNADTSDFGNIRIESLQGSVFDKKPNFFPEPGSDEGKTWNLGSSKTSVKNKSWAKIILARDGSLLNYDAGTDEIAEKKMYGIMVNKEVWSYDAGPKGRRNTKTKVICEQGVISITSRNGMKGFSVKYREDQLDYTSAYLPLDKLRVSSPKTYRMLDLEKGDIINTMLLKSRNDIVTVGEKKYECVVIMSQVGPMKTKKWMTRDENGYGMVVKEIVRVGSEEQEVILTECKTAM